MHQLSGRCRSGPGLSHRCSHTRVAARTPVLAKWSTGFQENERVRQFSRQASESARRAFEGVSNKAHEQQEQLRDWFQQTSQRVGEKVSDFEQKHNIKQNVSLFVEDTRRKWPFWSRQFTEFMNTPQGKALFGVLFCWSIYSGFLFHVLAVVARIWFFSLPVFIMMQHLALSNMQARRQQMREEYFNRANGFGATGFGGPQKQQQQRGASTSQQPRNNNPFARWTSRQQPSSSADGPVVDVKWRNVSP